MIIPIYNKEDYLERAIDSIINQNYKNLEIILVDDGSTDNSLKIIREYSNMDSRIKVITQKNSGVSKARNKGLEIAKGEYVNFIDTDDWLDLSAYKRMIEKIEETDADACMYNYNIEKNGITIPVRLPIQKDMLDGRNEIYSHLLLKMIASDNLQVLPIFGSSWRYLFRRKSISYFFDEDLPLMEDLVFVLENLSRAKRIVIDHTCYYHYFSNKNSVTNNYIDGYYQIELKVLNKIESFFSFASGHDYNNRILIRNIGIILGTISNETLNHNQKFHVKMRFLVRIVNEFNVDKNQIRLKNDSLRYKIILNLLKNKHVFPIYLYYRIINIVKLWRL